MSPRHETPADRTERLQKAALKADDAYHAELVRAYGRRAGDMRFKFTHADPKVDRAMHAKLDADKAWHAALDAEQSR